VLGVGLELSGLDELMRDNLRVLAAVGVVASAVVLGVWPRHSFPRLGGAWATPLLIGAGVALGHFALRDDARTFPPIDASDWTPWVVAGGALVGLVESLRAWSPRGRLLLRSGPCLALAWLILRPVLHAYGTPQYGSWVPGTDTALLATLGAAALVLAFSWLVDGLQDPEPEDRWEAGLAPLTLLVLASLGSLAVGLGGSESLALQGGLVVAVLAPLAGRGLLAPPGERPPALLGPGATLPLTLAMLGTWLSARTYSELPAASIGLLLAVPLVASLSRIEVLRTRRVAGLALSVLAAALLAGGAAYLAFSRTPSVADLMGGGAADYADTVGGDQSADDYSDLGY
jgi:hypothetical protein